jgi:hypothetical protein
VIPEKVAVVVGGWHWPLDFFEKMTRVARGAELFVIAHRSPELPIVRAEKREILASATGPLADLDREMYREFPTIDRLCGLGWSYEEAPNTIGDWEFFNQWLDRNDFRKYSMILNCHDDTYIRSDRHLAGMTMDQDWLLLANGTYPQAPAGYVRGSFEFWKRELIEMLGGRIPLGDVRLTREGKSDSPAGIAALSEWNDTALPVRNFMVSRGLTGKIKHLSPHYRVSPWVIEGERGFLHKREGAPWSFEAGLKAYPVEVAA